MSIRWHKVAALVLLLWAVVDLCVPALCQADSQFFPVQQQSSNISLDQSKDSQSNSPATDDDCFCCSSHVSPTPHFDLLVMALTQTGAVPEPTIRLLEFAEPHYQPPRA